MTCDPQKLGPLALLSEVNRVESSRNQLASSFFSCGYLWGAYFPQSLSKTTHQMAQCQHFLLILSVKCVLDLLFLPMSSVSQIKDIVTSLFAYTPMLTSPFQFILCTVARFSVFLAEKTLPSCHFPACNSRWLPISYHAESRFF